MGETFFAVAMIAGICAVSLITLTLILIALDIIKV